MIETPNNLLGALGPEMKMDVHWIDVELSSGARRRSGSSCHYQSGSELGVLGLTDNYPLRRCPGPNNSFMRTPLRGVA